MEAAAPPTATSISPCGFFLSQPGWSWNPATVASVSSCLILQCLIQPALQQQQKITAVVFVAVAFSGTKAQWGCISGRGIFAEAGQQRIQIVFHPFLSKPHLPHPTISHWKWSTPLPQICWSQGRTGWEKHTIHKSLNFTNCDMLWFAQYICELINWKFCLQDFYCVQ